MGAMVKAEAADWLFLLVIARADKSRELWDSHVWEGYIVKGLMECTRVAGLFNLIDV